MIRVQVTVAAGPNEVARFQVALLRKQVREQSIRGDVKWHAQKQVRASLIQLARQAFVRHVKLEKRVTRQERHAAEFPDVPGADDNPPRLGVSAQTLDRLSDLVDRAPIRGKPGAPLLAVHRPKFTVCIGPFIPDGYAMLVE